MASPLRFSVFIATSLDGFIARSNGSIDWLDKANTLVYPKDEDCGYGKFMSDVSGLVMGRNTFEKVLSFPSWPYGTLPVFVLSRTLKSLPSVSPSSSSLSSSYPIPSSVVLSSKTPLELAQELQKSGHTKIYVDGGKTIQSFLKVGLIDDLTITTIPVLIHSGLSLFSSSPSKRKEGKEEKEEGEGEGEGGGDDTLELISFKSFPFGFVQNHYQVKK